MRVLFCVNGRSRYRRRLCRSPKADAAAAACCWAADTIAALFLRLVSRET